MKTSVRSGIATILCVAMLFFQACSPDDSSGGKGEVEFQVTDAPTDDANVKGVFVTIADIKVNGQSLAGFTKQTIDLKEFQNGSVKVLGSAQLDANTYRDMVLVLDVDADAAGTGPGCYVLTTDDSKYKLRSGGKIELIQTAGWTIFAGAKTIVVLDFDLRKAVRSSNDAAIRYQFVADDNLRAAVRLVSKGNSGNISGTYTESVGIGSEKVIVYAYKKGTFNTITEIIPYGDDAILFKSAITSAEVKGGLTGNSYMLAFLEEGEYELRFASYKKDPLSGKFVLQSMLKTQTSASGADVVTIKSGSNITVKTIVDGTI